MDTIYNLKDLVVPVIGCYKGQPGKVVGIRTRDLDDLQVITVRFAGIYRPVEYLPSDVRPLFESPIAVAQLINAAIAEDIVDEADTAPGLLFQVPGWTNTDYSEFWEATAPIPGEATPLSAYGDESYDEQDGLVGEFFDDLGLVEDSEPLPGEYPSTDSAGMYRSLKYPGRAG
jgi:hypothetical protein